MVSYHECCCWMHFFYTTNISININIIVTWILIYCCFCDFIWKFILFSDFYVILILFLILCDFIWIYFEIELKNISWPYFNMNWFRINIHFWIWNSYFIAISFENIFEINYFWIRIKSPLIIYFLNLNLIRI